MPWRSLLSSSLVLICSDTTPKVRKPSHASPPAKLYCSLMSQAHKHKWTNFFAYVWYARPSPKTSCQITGYPIC